MKWGKRFKALKLGYRLLIVGTAFVIVYWIVPGIWSQGHWMIYIDRPYRGRIIDMENKKPIEGMAVFAEYSIKGLTLGGVVTAYVVAKEALTDKDGIFELPHFFRIGLWPLNYFSGITYISIFKPAYPCTWINFYPQSRAEYHPYYKVDKCYSQHGFVTVEVKKLKTWKERWDNLDCFPSSIYNDKKSRLFQLRNQERINLGLEPIPE